MSKVADIEKLKLLAEDYLRLTKEAKELKKLMQELVKDTDIEIHERLSEGGLVTYQKPDSKTVIDRKLVNELLFSILINYNQEGSGQIIPSIPEMEQQIKEQCQVVKEYKWKLSIKAK